VLMFGTPAGVVQSPQGCLLGRAAARLPVCDGYAVVACGPPSRPGPRPRRPTDPRGGLRADLLTEGVIDVGAIVRVGDELTG
jgi:hypothetical protein